MRHEGLSNRIQAERIVLGMVLLNPRYFLLLSEEISEYDFQTEKHRCIFSRMAEMNDRCQTIDDLSLALNNIDIVIYVRQVRQSRGE